MTIKLKDDPVFLLASLCLFFPIGLIFLIRSELQKAKKWLIGTIGLFVFTAFLTLAFLNQPHPVDASQFQLIVTRETLSVGQSGGFTIANDHQYITDYRIEQSNDTLKLQDSIYTAIKPGKCTLTATFSGIEKTVEITVNDNTKTDSIVLASPQGERYHIDSAKHAGKKALKMTEEEALLSGKTPCKICYK